MSDTFCPFAVYCCTQALLDEWRAEAARKPLGMTEAEACQALEVSLAEDQELDEDMLKAAYRLTPLHCSLYRCIGLCEKEGWAAVLVRSFVQVLFI